MTFLFFLIILLNISHLIISHLIDLVLLRDRKLQTESEEEMEKKKYVAQRRLMDLSRAYFSKLFAQASHYGLHPGQIPILGILEKNNGISQRELAKMLGVKPSTVTISIQRLGKNGLVECCPDEWDKRKSCLHLTEKGQQVNQKMNEILEMNERYMLVDFSEEEIKCLNGFLERVIYNIGEAPETIQETDEENKYM